MERIKEDQIIKKCANSLTNIFEKGKKYKINYLDISSIDKIKVSRLDSLFAYYRSLISLDLSTWHTSSVKRMDRIFYYCNSLTSLDLSNFDFSNVTNVDFMFYKCTSLTDLKFGKNLKVSLDLSDCPLSHESALSVIDGLAKVEKAFIKPFVKFSSKAYSSLTDEEIKLVTDKNWKISFNN